MPRSSSAGAKWPVRCARPRSGDSFCSHPDRRRAVLSLPLLFAVGRNARAEAYPARPIKFIVPWPAGGVADTIARITAEKLSTRLGQNLIVDNRPGASGNIGMAATAAAPADGYTLVLTPTNSLTVNQTLYKNLPFDTARDFLPLTILATVPNVLVVNRTVPANSVAELVAYARANPGKLSFASPGLATGAHLAGELLKVEAGIDMLHVPYTGIAPALNDVVGERVSLMFLGISSALPFIRAGSLRPLAVAALERSPLLPEVPLVADAGYPGFDVTSWYGIAVRSGTPAEIVDRLYRETAAILTGRPAAARLRRAGPQRGEEMGRHRRARQHQARIGGGRCSPSRAT
ncbi:MAG: tripartite tricarboxylate transporter substrate binding protein [Alphaproteobacteria bacterium]|nr:MAG: tripartite tricarboxylate transporter substrate binding protein [Alphaproteobacteria bacterium]